METKLFTRNSLEMYPLLQTKENICFSSQFIIKALDMLNVFICKNELKWLLTSATYKKCRSDQVSFAVLDPCQSNFQ